MSRVFHELPIIEDVGAGRYPAPELGGPLRTTIRKIAVADSLTGAEAELVAGLDLGARLALVGDENTWPVLGARVAAALPGAQAILLDHPKADEAHADLLQERARHADALVAVGSGTLNDLCKYVTHRTGRRCAVFATAPSMNGYVTSTASITGPATDNDVGKDIIVQRMGVKAINAVTESMQIGDEVTRHLGLKLT